MNKPRVLIVDRSLDEFSALLQDAPTIHVVGKTPAAQQAITLAGQLQPDVVLFNVDTLCANDVQLVARLNQLHPHVKLMLVGANALSECLALEAYRQGVRAYLDKTQHTLAEIIEAVRALSRGESVLSEAMAGWILDEITSGSHQKGTP